VCKKGTATIKLLIRPSMTNFISKYFVQNRENPMISGRLSTPVKGIL
jgi:hypothetical protein